MQNFIDIIKDVLTTHWGNYAYQGMFYFSLIVIFVLERDKIKKHMFATYTLVVMLTIINPITIKFLEVFFGKGGYIAYYQRIFSTIPLICIIAYGFVLLLNELEGLKKMLLTLVMCFMVIIGGNNIYATDWMQKADNLTKIPLETIEICDYLTSEKSDVTVAVPSSLVCDIRQIDASLYMPYGRKGMHRWGMLLDEETPYVSEVLVNAGVNGCNYIVVHNTKEWKQGFLEFGLQPSYVTDNYLVYEVKGVDRCVLTYNDLRQVENKLFLDKNNNFRYENYGYASISYEYDDDGKAICEIYKDGNGNITNTTYGYAKKSMFYNEEGQMIKEVYYDEHEEIAILPKGNSAIIKDYDNNGRVIQATYLDSRGNAILNSDGYASIEYEYNEDGYIYIQMYYDVNHKPIALENGSFGVKYEYDDFGYVYKTTYLDKNGRAMLISGGYAILETDRDEDNKIIYERYYDIDGKPIIINKAYYGQKREYDERGNLKKIYFVDQQEELVDNSWGYAIIEYLYDDENNRIGESYYNSMEQSVSKPD